MNSIVKQNNRKAAFTIVELLTVMSIIVILIGLLVPALNKVKRYARDVKQKAQFHSIDAAVELFNNDFDGYPGSRAMDQDNELYCGAMKLCEAIMGQDLMGYHSNSVFKANGWNTGDVANLYPPNPPSDNLKARKGPFLPSESANAYQLQNIAEGGSVTPFDSAYKNYVLCDVYNTHARNSVTGDRVGMPILYYKADTSCNLHGNRITDITPFNNEDNIYNYLDNQALLGIGKLWLPAAERGKQENMHKLAPPSDDGAGFYKYTESHKITTTPRPYRADSYILISAGYDGEYGTADDICNFEWKYKD